MYIATREMNDKRQSSSLRTEESFRDLRFDTDRHTILMDASMTLAEWIRGYLAMRAARVLEEQESSATAKDTAGSVNANISGRLGSTGTISHFDADPSEEDFVHPRFHVSVPREVQGDTTDDIMTGSTVLKKKSVPTSDHIWE